MKAWRRNLCPMIKLCNLEKNFSCYETKSFEITFFHKRGKRKNILHWNQVLFLSVMCNSCLKCAEKNSQFTQLWIPKQCILHEVFSRIIHQFDLSKNLSTTTAFSIPNTSLKDIAKMITASWEDYVGKWENVSFSCFRWWKNEP